MRPRQIDCLGGAVREVVGIRCESPQGRANRPRCAPEAPDGGDGGVSSSGDALAAIETTAPAAMQNNAALRKSRRIENRNRFRMAALSRAADGRSKGFGPPVAGVSSTPDRSNPGPRALHYLVRIFSWLARIFS